MATLGPFDWIGASVDQAVRRVAFTPSGRRRKKSPEALGPRERKQILLDLCEAYGKPEYFDQPSTFFTPPEKPRIQTKHVRRFKDGIVVDWSWASGYQPINTDVAAGYLRQPENGTAQVRAFLHEDRPRPAVLLLHGYLGGHHPLEERLWPIEWMFRKGLDVMLCVLPFHGLRSGGQKARFPAADIRVTIEGFRQSVHDLRALTSHLMHRGGSKVGVMGMSLGGYTSALLATVDPRLSFVVPFIPLASIADFARDGGRLVGTRSQRLDQHRLLDDAHAVVSPLRRPPLVPPEGRLIVAAHGDRITPPGHAERLAEHFDAPLSMFRGGHLLQLGRTKGFRAVGRMLGELGVLEP